MRGMKGPEICDHDEIRDAEAYEVFHGHDCLDEKDSRWCFKKTGGYAFFSPVSAIHGGFDSFSAACTAAEEYERMKA